MDDLKFEELKDIVESLCKTLTCAICLGYLHKDVLTCVNGHCVCTKCCTNMKNKLCPTCREEFSNVQQNSLARQVMDIIPRTCIYNNCSYKVKMGDDHESYCHFKPTPCRYCEQEVPAVELSNHITDNHPTKCIFTENNCTVLSTQCNDESFLRQWTFVSLHNVFGNFIWKSQNFNPITGVLTITFTPIFCGKPTGDLYVKVSFKSDEVFYVACTKIEMKITIAGNIAQDSSLIIPTSVVEKIYDNEKNKYKFEISITKTKEDL